MCCCFLRGQTARLAVMMLVSVKGLVLELHPGSVNETQVDQKAALRCTCFLWDTCTCMYWPWCFFGSAGCWCPAQHPRAGSMPCHNLLVSGDHNGGRPPLDLTLQHILLTSAFHARLFSGGSGHTKGKCLWLGVRCVLLLCGFGVWRVKCSTHVQSTG